MKKIIFAALFATAFLFAGTAFAAEDATQNNANPSVPVREIIPLGNSAEPLSAGVIAQLKKQGVFNPKARAAAVKKYAGKFIYVKEPGNGDWYVDPVSGKRYLVDKSHSMKIVNKVAILISLKDIVSIPAKTTRQAFPNQKIEFDADGDGLPDLDEKYFGTKTNDTDSDGDGFSDTEELSKGYDPLGVGKIKLNAGIYKKYENRFVRLPNGNVWFVAKNARYPIFGDNEAYAAFAIVGGTYVPLSEINQIAIGDERLLKQFPQTKASEMKFESERHVLGNKNAKVTLVEFSDFQCQFCSRFSTVMREILKNYGTKVRFVYKHFPLDSTHLEARPAAVASECAYDQKGNDAFFKFHDEFFANQDKLGKEFYVATAKKAGLNVSKFERCLDDPSVSARVDADYKEGLNKELQGTPSTFVNGSLISGAMPYDAVKKVIDLAL